MQISNNGIELIKRFEGCRLVAYKAVKTEEYYTIGYGHYGADVFKGMTISQSQAEEYLKKDLKKFEGYVNKYVTSFKPNQNQFDSLVSFTYNCGLASLQKLTKGRTAEQIAKHITSYVFSGGQKLEGLVKRRNAEKELFLKEDLTVAQYEELLEEIKKLNKRVETLEKEVAPVYYDWTTACPDWSQPYVHKALELGILKGDTEGRLRLTDVKIFALVMDLRNKGIMQ